MRTDTLNVSELIDRRPITPFQIRTLAFCGIVLTLDGFDAQSIGFLAPSISETLAIPLKTFGPIFMAGPIGLMVAALAVGPVADHWGRRWTAIVSTLTFATFSIATAHATSSNELVLLRFLTGLGLGGAMPNVVALTSEYSPRRLQPVFVAALFAGMPLGALIASLASQVLIPLWGWRSVFYLGGILPLIIAAALVRYLPESIRFLAVRGGPPEKLAKIIAQISPDDAARPVLAVAPAERRARFPLRALFTEGRALGTILLWIPFFMNLLIIYFIVNWLPGLLREAGLPATAGVTAISMFSSGGVIASLLQGRLMNAAGAHPALVTEFGLSALLIAGLSFSTSSYLLLMSATFIVGAVVQGAQAGLNALSAAFYPTAIRSTGVGWCLGVGRVGSIVGPMLGGLLLSRDWGPQQILLAGAVPAVVGCVAILLASRFQSTVGAFTLESAAGGHGELMREA